MWEYLPDIILEQIYFLLSMRQRYNCSLVCKHWSDVLHSPSLWRNMIFTESAFTRKQKAEDLKKVLRLTFSIGCRRCFVMLDLQVCLYHFHQRYVAFSGYRDEIYHRRLQMYLANVGHHCQTIIFRPINNFFNLHEYLRVLSCFVEFFDDYSFPLLTKFCFTFACENREYKEVQLIGTGGQVLDEIKRVLRDLRDLTDLTLNHLLLDVSDAGSLLNDVVRNCQDTLKCLEILNVTKVYYTIDSISQLHSLKKLYLSRRQISPKLLISICKELTLEELILVQDEYSSYLCKTSSAAPAANPDANPADAAAAAAALAEEEQSHLIDRLTWLQAAQMNPALRVRLEFRRSCTSAIEASDDVIKGELLPDGAPVYAVVHDAPNSHISFQSVAQITELYAESLQIYGHVGRGRGARSKSFHDRADCALVYLVRHCPHLKVLAVHERISTCTLLILASEAKKLQKLYVRKNSVILRFDWTRNLDWTDEFWLWLKENSRSYEKTEREISRLLRCKKWSLLPDKLYRFIKHKV